MTAQLKENEDQKAWKKISKENSGRSGIRNVERKKKRLEIKLEEKKKDKDKAMERSDTDDFLTKIESLQWVLFVIFAIKNERMVVI